jgi:O-antigen ligase
VRILLIALLWVLTASDVMSLDLSLAPGLSVKNAMLNLIAAFLVVRIVVQGKFKLEIPVIVMSLAVTFLYALGSIFIASFVVDYPHYSLRDSIVALKYDIVDPALLLLMYFYGARTAADSIAITKALLVAMAVASLITITNVYGLTDIGATVFGGNDNYEANRVFGFFGHANETGTLIVVLLPAYLAMYSGARDFWRPLSIAAMMVTVVVLIMTGSRGALAGLAIGGAWAAFLCRRQLSLTTITRNAGPVALVGLPIVLILGAKYGQEFFQRILSQGSSVDVGELSSGRTELWAKAIGRMMEAPLSTITGFGWNVYDSMGFPLIPHNHYIATWFELGLVGLLCFVFIIRQIMVRLLRAFGSADQQTRPYLVAAVFGVTILLVAIFFEQLFKPWLYIWPYLGVSLRAAVDSRSAQTVRRRKEALAVAGPLQVERAQLLGKGMSEKL